MTNPTSRKPRASDAQSASGASDAQGVSGASDAQNASSTAAIEQGEEIPALRITAKVAGFRRCGIAHPDTPTDYPAGRFTEAEILRLEAEPMLVVQRLAGPEADTDEAATGPKEA